VRTGGIDLAAQPRDTALCIVEWDEGAARVAALERPVDDAALERAADGLSKLGVDVPLGWPRAFVAAIAAHQQLGRWPTGDARALRFRRTDLVTRERTGAWPLSVSTDRIAIPAFRAARLLAVEPRDGSGTVVEVYPAASLRLWGFDPRGYKAERGREVRERLVARFAEAAPWLHLGRFESAFAASDDAFAALVAALKARAAALGLTQPPRGSDVEAARTEGWIALPECSLAELASGAMDDTARSL
jgi:predicted nuclease with RNAse H fold